MRKWRTWMTQVTLAAVAVGVVLAAPLASPNPAAADNITISGARSLADRVSVRYGTAKQGETTDVHLLAFNDLHGNLEAAGNNIYGRFAGGAAYLAKAVKDKQATYGDNQATVFAGDNIGASPLQNGLFFEEPIVIASNLMNVDFASVGNHEFDKGSAELKRIQNGGCHPTGGCTAAPYALANGSSTNVYPGADFQYLSSNVVVNETGSTLFPSYATKRFKSDSGKKFSVGFLGEVLESHADDRHPDGSGRPDLPGRGGRRERDRSEPQAAGRRHVRRHVGARHPRGRVPVGYRGSQRVRRESRRQRDRRDRQPARSEDQGDRVGPHARRVPLHDHVRRRDPPDHERCFVRADPHRHHAHDQRQER